MSLITLAEKLTTGKLFTHDTVGNDYELSRYVRRAVPDLFDETKGVVFVGTSEELLSREPEINEYLEQVNKAHLNRSRHGEKLGMKKIDTRTDAEVSEHIADIFASLRHLSEAAANLKIRSMIVSGSPGVGKSYEVTRALTQKKKTNPKFYFNIVKGTISPIALYSELFSAREGVLVLDDCDEAFNDQESIQLLKAATESNKVRTISYRKYSNVLDAEGIPNSFEFTGCVIILTNTNLERAKTQKQSHFDAVISRAHYLNTVLETDREKLLRIKDVIETTDILSSFVCKEKHQLIVNFLDNYHQKARELSIRTVVKIAELCSAFPDNWERIARGTLLVNR